MNPIEKPPMRTIGHDYSEFSGLILFVTVIIVLGFSIAMVCRIY